jgi:hypothetical protein
MPTTDQSPFLFAPIVTWDTSYFVINSTVYVHVDYANNTGGAQPVYVSNSIPNALGYGVVLMDGNWLTGLSQNNLTILLVGLDPVPDQHPTWVQGPTVMLMRKPPTHYQPSPRINPNKISLMIGLPVSLGFVVVCIIVLVWRIRRSKSASFRGLRGLIGGNRGYGGSKSRRQRLGLGKKKGSIRLAEEELAATDEQFRDEPARGTAVQLGQRNIPHSRDHSFGSLVSSEGGGYSDAPRRARDVPDERATFGVPRHHMD